MLLWLPLLRLSWWLLLWLLLWRSSWPLLRLLLWPGGRARDCHVAGRLKREEGATLFRLRWCDSGPHHAMARQPTAIRHLTTRHIHFTHIFGVVCRYGLSPMDLNSVYVERKTHHEKWTQQRSQKDRPHPTSCIFTSPRRCIPFARSVCPRPEV